jgi:hypothetical protein
LWSATSIVLHYRSWKESLQSHDSHDSPDVDNFPFHTAAGKQ